MGVASDTYLVGLIGRDIAASRSPWLHEQEAGAQGLRLLYMLHDFAQRGWDEADLPRVLAAMRTLGAAGCNVTYPYKQAVIGHLDGLSPQAAAVGAVNTVVFADGRAIGHNTDVIGFGEALAGGIGGRPAGTVVQVGAGGAGAATAQALMRHGVEQLALFDVDQARATALAARLQGQFPAARITAGTSLPGALAAADGLVNATPMGMAKLPGLPVPAECLGPQLWVADIVYFPLETALIAESRRRGCAVIDGSAMAIGQAAAAFTLFTGRPADRARMRASFDSFAPARAA
ncbi:MAG: shikimate dehydrogenase [Alphaproteobacteria bacterium]|nr:shikimate dehydrogenase [Alphaproteobacteria bacterium]